MISTLAELFDKLPGYLGWHLFLSLAALLVGLVFSLPLGILCARRSRLAEFALSVAGVIQTVPTLALLALMVLILGGLIGFWPAFLALTLYSILPILANTILGIRGVDPTLTEAARALGMNSGQMLWQIQLPLAAPVIIGGVRTATVLAVGTATLVTPVGGTSLGNYIFAGLESLNHLETVFGCVCAALLAVALDQLIRLLQLSAGKRDRKRFRLAVTGLGLVVLAGLAAPTARLLAAEKGWGVVASGPFTEQNILSEVLARQLEPAGFRPDQRQGMSEGIQFEALRHNQIDCMVNYSGNIWTLVMKRSDFPPRDVMLAEISDYLVKQRGVVCLGRLGFRNDYAFALPRKKAEQLGLKSIDDLANLIARRPRTAPKLKIGGDNQFFHRPEWHQVCSAYQINPGAVETRAMDPAMMYGAVDSGQMDVIAAYTSDGRIKAYDLVVLDDPREAFPPYDALLLVSAKAARRPGFVASLEPLVGAIDAETMREANRQVDVLGQSPRAVGRALGDRLVGGSP